MQLRNSRNRPWSFCYSIKVRRPWHLTKQLFAAVFISAPGITCPISIYFYIDPPVDSRRIFLSPEVKTKYESFISINPEFSFFDLNFDISKKRFPIEFVGECSCIQLQFFQLNEMDDLSRVGVATAARECAFHLLWNFRMDRNLFVSIA